MSKGAVCGPPSCLLLEGRDVAAPPGSVSRLLGRKVDRQDQEGLSKSAPALFVLLSCFLFS